jgi:protein-disulfide isomerase
MIFQVRNLPLTSLHPNAFSAARAAEAAGLQNKYWEMHDALYENQTAWSASSNPLSFFDAYATQLGLNKASFDKDYASEQVNNAINADTAAFGKTGDEMATPTFYLDGKKLDNTTLIDTSGRPSAASFEKVINAEIAKKTQSAKN